MTTTRRKPADRLPKQNPAVELPKFDELNGHEYFKQLSEISADSALDAIEAVEDSGFKDKGPDEITTRDLRTIMRIVFTEDFISDIEAFRTEFYTAEHTEDAGILAVAFLGLLGKGRS